MSTTGLVAAGGAAPSELGLIATGFLPFAVSPSTVTLVLGIANIVAGLVVRVALHRRQARRPYAAQLKRANAEIRELRRQVRRLERANE